MKTIIFTVVLLLSFDASADSAKFCFSVNAFFTDCGRTLEDNVTKEDYYHGNGSCSAGEPVVAHGARVVIRQNSSSGALLFSGNLGDGLGTGDPGSGCANISPPNINSTYYFSISTESVVQSNMVEVVNGQDDSSAPTISLNGIRTISGKSSGDRIDIATSSSIQLNQSIWSAFLATSFALYRHAGNMTEKNYRIEVGPKGNYANIFRVHLTTGGARRKFTVVHEIGHMLAAHGGFSTGGQCGTNISTGQCQAFEQEAENDSSTASLWHSMGSFEKQECAFSEAFGHFYAADVWNSHSQDDCQYAYYKDDIPTANTCSGCTALCYQGKCYSRPVVDCAPNAISCSGDECTKPARVGSNVGYSQRHMIDLCGGPYSNNGTEVDWLRALWTVHTRGSSPPSFNAMREWLTSSYGFWTFGSPHTRLTYEADNTGGSLSSNWDYAVSTWGLVY